MQASDGFNVVNQKDNALDEYTLLPSTWQTMLPQEKKAAVEIVKKFGNRAWGVGCCRELMQGLKVKLSDIVSLQLAIFLAIGNPSHVDRGIKYEKT